MSKYPDKSFAEIASMADFRSDPALERIKFLTMQNLLTIQPKPIRNVLDPFFPEQGIVFIYAATGVGKTLFTLNCAYAIAAGGSFLKYNAPLPRKVLYVDGEMPYNQLHSRIMNIVMQQGELFIPDNWMMLNHEMAAMPIPKICTAVGQEFFNRKIAELGIEVLVLDNLATLSTIDENSSTEWIVVQDWLLSLRAKGVSVLIVHHAGKDKKGYRGTSKMLDVADSAISLQDINTEELEQETSQRKCIKISYTKARNFGGKDSYDFEATLDCMGWSHRSIEKTNIEKVVDLYKIGLKQVEIARELGFGRSYISKLVARAKYLNLITD